MCALAGVELDDLSSIYDQLRRDQRWVEVPGTDVYAVPAAIEDMANRLVNWLERFHKRNPEHPGRPADAVLGYLERTASKVLARPLFDRFVKENKIRLFGPFVCLPAFAPELSSADERILRTMVKEIKDGRFQPPSPSATSGASKADRKRVERLASLAVATGELVKIDADIYLHRDTEAELRERVSKLIRDQDGATVSQIREELDSSRKFVVPMMEYLDRIGFTKRVGDKRALSEK
jgi:selenocysteine-specific elongation factor